MALPGRKKAGWPAGLAGHADRRLLDGFAMRCSFFVLSRYQGYPGDRMHPPRKSGSFKHEKIGKQADPENSKSRKRTGSGLRER
jgi:hypothetical protein